LAASSDVSTVSGDVLAVEEKNSGDRRKCFGKSAAMPVDPFPEGKKASSRWLSEATPPDAVPKNPSASRRDARWGHVLQPDRPVVPESAIPAGMGIFYNSLSGGVAALNHRLLAGKPPASVPANGIKRSLPDLSLAERFRAWTTEGSIQPNECCAWPAGSCAQSGKACALPD
jgi:hypothetical protein